MVKLTYADFKVGQEVVCLKNEAGGGFWEERLIVGEKYTIDDLDFHFPDSICVKLKGPYYFHSEFVPTKFFYDELTEIRDRKLKQILDEPL